MNSYLKLFKKWLNVKDKKWINNITILFVTGVLCLLLSSFFNGGDNSTDVKNDSNNLYMETHSPPTLLDNNLSYEEELENRLSLILSEAEGIGKTKVMLTLSYGKEIIIAENLKASYSKTNETDKDGGAREITENDENREKLYITNENGIEEPLILKENSPKIEGVIVLCEGGDDINVKSRVIQAVQTVLGVESHKVQVLKMNSK